MQNTPVAPSTPAKVLDGWTWHKDKFEEIFGQPGRRRLRAQLARRDAHRRRLDVRHAG